MQQSLPRIIFLFVESFKQWQKDQASMWCAALSYYTVFSLGSILVLLISILGIILGKTTIEKNIYTQSVQIIGAQGSSMIKSILQSTDKPSAGIIGSIISIGTLILGTIGVVGQLEQMLNFIWGVKAKPRTGIWPFIKDRLLNFSFFGAIAFLLLVSFAATAIISLLAQIVANYLPISASILEHINFLISFVGVTLLFALMFKILPDVQVAWNNIWPSALITSLFFTIGKTVIGIYIGHSSISSTYGAAGSVMVLFLWIYYAAQIIFYGAELSKVYTLQHAGKIVPSKYAEIVRVQMLPGKQKQKRNPQESLFSFFSSFFEGFSNRLEKR